MVSCDLDDCRMIGGEHVRRAEGRRAARRRTSASRAADGGGEPVGAWTRITSLSIWWSARARRCSNGCARLSAGFAACRIKNGRDHLVPRFGIYAMRRPEEDARRLVRAGKNLALGARSSADNQAGVAFIRIWIKNAFFESLCSSEDRFQTRPSAQHRFKTYYQPKCNPKTAKSSAARRWFALGAGGRHHALARSLYPAG